MDSLTVNLLGTPTIHRNGRPVYIRRRKALAVLVYLATSQRMHGRDELAGLFWPEQSQQAARGNLRRAIFSLHRLLGSDTPQVEGDRVGLPVGTAVTVDVVEFRTHIKSARRRPGLVASAAQEFIDELEHAVALYQADFARSLSLADCPEFEEWLRTQSESLLADLGWALTALVDRYTELDAIDEAISHARRLQELDPYSDEALQQLMRLYATAGQLGAAIRLYERYAKLLAQDLDMPPGEDSKRLYQQLRAGAIPVRPGQSHRSTARPDVHPDPAFLAPSNANRVPGSIDIGSHPLFVAREFALGTLTRAFDAVRRGLGQVIFVAGEAGSGKTTLIEEFGRRLQLQNSDAIMATGTCTALGFAAEPLQPFVEIVRRLTGVSSLDSAAAESAASRARRAQEAAIALQAVNRYGANLVGRVIPNSALAQPGETERQAGAPDPAPLPQTSDETTTNHPMAPILGEFTAVFQAIAGQRPLLLVLDDLQWADPSSVALLYHLARRSGRHRILIVGAFRPEEVPWNSSPSQPLSAVMEELQQHLGSVRISLDVQEEAEARHFVDALLDSEPNRLDEAFRRELFHHSRGHALFTVELLQQMKETGQLLRGQDGYWVRGEQVDWRVLPSKVEASIARRFHRLSPTHYRMLAVASIEGEWFTAEVLAQVLNTDTAGVIAQLSQLAQSESGLVVGLGIERTGAVRFARYRFRHNLFQQYLYHALDATERQHLHEQVGCAIEALYQADADALASMAAVLANHFDQAADVDAAGRYYLLAGQRAVRMSAFAEAREHLSRGLSQVRSLPVGQRSVERELDLVQELSAPLGILLGYGHPELNALFTEAYQLATQLKDRRKVFRTMHGIWRYWGLRSEMEQTRQLADELVAIAEEQQEVHLQMHAWRAKGITAFHVGALNEAGAWLSRSLALYDPVDHATHVQLYGHDPGVSATGYLAHVHWLQGDADSAVALAAEALRLAEKLDHPFSLAHALGFAAADISKFQRRPEQVLATTERLAVLAKQHSYPMWTAISEILGGWARAAQGGHAEGVARLRRGLDAWQAMGNRALLPYYVGLLAEAYSLAGDRPHALETVNHALILAEQTEDRWWEPQLRRLHQELQ